MHGDILVLARHSEPAPPLAAMDVATTEVANNGGGTEHSEGSAGGGGLGNGVGTSHSRRPMNAFLLFCKRHRAIVREKYPTLENRNITKILGEWWQSLTDEEKGNFNELANEFKDHVIRSEPNFRWRKPPPQSVNTNQPPTTSTIPAVITSKPVAIAAKSGKSVHPPSMLSSSSMAPPTVEVALSGSNSSSNSSSPEPSSPVNASAVAPKPIKKRYLAAEKAKMSSTEEQQQSVTVSAIKVSPEAENACKALLELAGVRESSPALREDGSNAATPATSGRESRSGTASPPERSKGPGFSTLREAVLGNVARTLMKQDLEKVSENTENAPLNLSSQCTIRSQNIIEHIIENILPDGEQGLNLNNNGMVNGTNGSGGDEGKIKETILEDLRKDRIKRSDKDKDEKNVISLWDVLPHTNITSSKPAKKSSSSSSSPSATPSATPAPVPLPTTLSSAIRLPTVPVTTNGVASRSANSPNEAQQPPPRDIEDPAKLNIKNLLAQSPAPVSPRSKNSTTPTSSLTNAVIASVLQQQQPVMLFGGATNPPLMEVKKKQPPVSVTLVPASSKQPSSNTVPLNLSTTSSASSFSASLTVTPVTITPTAGSLVNSQISPSKRKHEEEEDDDEIRRSSRSTKGRRYQEFKDEGRLGRSKGRRSHRSGDHDDHPHPMAQLVPSDEAKTQPQPVNNTHSSFDIETRLSEIPALNLDLYQQKLKAQKAAGAGSAHGGGGSGGGGGSRRRSSETEDGGSGIKRKSRRTTATKDMEGDANPVS